MCFKLEQAQDANDTKDLTAKLAESDRLLENGK